MRMHELAERTDGLHTSRAIGRSRILLPVATKMRPASIYSLHFLYSLDLLLT